MKKTAKQFTVITGDLIRSKSLSSRKQTALKINRAIADLNAYFAITLYAPITTTRGMDELSAVLAHPKDSFRICRLLNQHIFPAQFRFAVSRGTLDIDVRSKDARRMDGPAFHKAAEIMTTLKKQDMTYGFYLGDSVTTYNELLSHLASLFATVSLTRSEHQHLITTLFEKVQHQKKVADQLKITQQAVSDSLKSAHWKELKRTEDVIDRTLGKL